jgi:putative Mg2+ transporter-C (MgtC) family protein
MAAAPTDADLVARVLTAAGLALPLGIERGIRGSSAPDRPFVLVAIGAAAVTAAVGKQAPNAVAGVITGVGFIGAGVVIQSGDGMVKGITTAASVFVVATIGVVAGSGRLVLAGLLASLVFLTLEIPYIPFLRALDTRRYQQRMKDDDPPMGM